MATSSSILGIIQQQRVYFSIGSTYSVLSRIQTLKKFKKALVAHEKAIQEALYKDLKKPSFEAFSGELFLVLQEIKLALRSLESWTQPYHVSTPWYLWPSKSSVHPEPRGCVLIIAPWNYPLQLNLIPLIGAIAAGNCALIKPSEFAPHTAAILDQIISKIFDPGHVSVIQGDSTIAQQLLIHQFDYIFFTGSTRVGKIVMHAAAEYLTPLTLELGGKSPCIIHKDASINLAAKRIAWGKFMNAGQNCVAPDYLLVHKDIKDAFITALKTSITHLYGSDPSYSNDYARIINEQHFDRLSALLSQGTIIVGGQIKKSDLYIAPTVIDNPKLQSPIMQEEIFGPLLPIITYGHINEAIEFINKKPKPLALYVFSLDHSIIHKKIINETSSGGVGINDVVVQVASVCLPFGGVGMSGFGQYHGKKSFDTFSHYKPIIKSNRMSFAFRFPPYKKLQHAITTILKKIFV